MAIYLKCSYGYLCHNGAFGSIPVENLVITDEDRYFIIPDGPGVFPPGDKTPEEFIADATDCLGDQFYLLSIYEFSIARSPGERYGINKFGTTWFPSAMDWAPNLAAAQTVGFAYGMGCVIFNDGDIIVTDGIIYRKSGSNYLYQDYGGAAGAVTQGVHIPCLMAHYTESLDLANASFGYLNCTTNSVGARPSSFVPNDTGTTNLWRAIFEVVTPSNPPSNDPYSPGGESDKGGGAGDFDGTGDNIDIPGLPTLSAVDTGFITLFNPSATELRNLASYMWSNPLFDLDAWKKLFADPMDAILGLSIVPVAVPNGGLATVTVGNISTGISMTKAAAQYVEVDCGTLNVNEFWGAYLDYDPYTKAEIYLPYVGTHPLAVDDIMGKSVHVVYHIDILSGACCAFVKCGGSVLYTFTGQCSGSIPITGNDWTNVVNGALSIAASIGTMVATGGATAPMGAAAIASAAVNSMKPSVEKSGSMGGMGGMMGVQSPYLILTRPRQALPAQQNKYTGYPSFITRRLSDLSGYTELEEIHLDNVTATEEELSEIVALLKGGVII